MTMRTPPIGALVEAVQTPTDVSRSHVLSRSRTDPVRCTATGPIELLSGFPNHTIAFVLAAAIFTCPSRVPVSW